MKKHVERVKMEEYVRTKKVRELFQVEKLVLFAVDAAEALIRVHRWPRPVCVMTV